MAAVASAEATSAVVPDEEQTDPEVSSSEAAAAQEVRLLTAAVQVVGIRYYNGVAHRGEMLNLVREPTNPYDRNAIRVDNVHNEQVGHVKGTMAVALAPVMDDMTGAGGVRYGVTAIDAIIPRPAGTYTMPAHLEFYGPSDPSKAEALVRLLSRHGIKPLSRSTGGASSSSFSSSAKKGGGGPPSVQSKTVVVKDWKSQAELDAMFDKQKALLEKVPTVPAPAQLTAKLLPHQVKGMSWMHHRETADHLPPFWKTTQEKGRTVWLSEITNASQPTEPRRVKGGLLCDEMGMGKSLMTIGLILNNPPKGHAYAAGDAIDQEEEDEEAVAGTSATEMEATTTINKPMPSAAQVKKLKVGQLRSIVTLPSTSEVTVDDMRKPALIDACIDGLEDGTISANRYWSVVDPLGSVPAAVASVEPARSSSETSCTVGCITTLIVCPVSVMHNWVEQVDIHVRPNVLRIELYQGPDRYSMLSQVRAGAIDILLVSYQTLAADFGAVYGNSSDKKKPSKKLKLADASQSIFSIPFHRVILDEAHTIRNGGTRACLACLKLQATSRFGLTGTPLQNKPDDICPLLAFLGCEPLGEKNVFRRAISQPIRNGDSVGLARLRATMCHFALRRTKDKEGIDLTDRTVQLCTVSFPPASVHEQIYNTLFDSAREAFSALLSAGENEALKEYMSVLETLLRIRQACCSGILIQKDRLKRAEQALAELKKRKDDGGKPLSAEEGKKLLEKLKGVFADDAEESECSVCLEEFPSERAIILRTCSHIFCQVCISKVVSMRNYSCPLCRCEFDKSDIVKMSTASVAASNAETPSSQSKQAVSCLDATDEELSNSPKVAALLKSINEMEADDEKAVIFSQFTSFLDVIEKALDANGHSFTRIDGKRSASDRIKAMKQFNSEEEDSPRFILCSLLAAGTGINLTRGNHVFMMDLWWNRSVEDQAMDRVHRIGQVRDVRVVKFVMEGSIEESIVKMQDAKAALGKGTLEKLSPEEMRKARVSALKDLFKIDEEASSVSDGA